MIINIVLGDPLSQYPCCIRSAYCDFVRENPVATKRFLPANDWAAAFCSADPAAAGRQIIDAGFARSYDHASDTVWEGPYDLWHDYDIENTMHYDALKMHEVGMLKAVPNKLLAEGADWRFVNELKREVKA